LLPPPPQLTTVISRTQVIRDSRFLRRLVGKPSRTTAAKAVPLVVINHGKSRRFPGLSIAAVAAVVATVSLVVPLPATEAGLKLQLAPVGRPEHDDEPNWRVPAKPSTAVTVRVRLPESPGADTVTLVALAVRAKSLVVDEVEAR